MRQRENNTRKRQRESLQKYNFVDLSFIRFIRPCRAGHAQAGRGRALFIDSNVEWWRVHYILHVLHLYWLTCITFKHVCNMYYIYMDAISMLLLLLMLLVMLLVLVIILEDWSRQREHIVGVNMVLAWFLKFKHGLYKSCGIECVVLEQTWRRRENIVGANMVLAESLNQNMFWGYYARTMFTPTMFSRGRRFSSGATLSRALRIHGTRQEDLWFAWSSVIICWTTIKLCPAEYADIFLNPC